MSTAIFMGATSGAVHAVTGPDHLLSLGSQTMNGARRAFRVGLYWGLGHGLGTLLLAVPLVLLGRLVGLEMLTAYSERIAGVALMTTALWTLRNTSGHGSKPETSAPKAPLAVGVFHGATGAGALVLMLPAFATTDSAFSMLFLVAFALGSTLSMATLTAALGLVGQRLNGTTAHVFQRVIGVAALGLGVAWSFDF